MSLPSPRHMDQTGSELFVGSALALSTRQPRLLKLAKWSDIPQRFFLAQPSFRDQKPGPPPAQYSADCWVMHSR